MKSFTYTYQDQILNAIVEHFTEGLKNRFRIYADSQIYIIAPVSYDKKNLIWLQAYGQPLDNDLIQAVGEGLEAAGLTY